MDGRIQSGHDECVCEHTNLNFKQQQLVDTDSRSRGLMRPSFAMNFLTLRSEGAGNDGRPVRPIAACAMVVVERTRVSQVTPESPGIPRAMVYGLFRALPGDRLSNAHIFV